METVVADAHVIRFLRNKVKLDFDQAHSWVTYPEQRELLVKNHRLSRKDGLKLHADTLINTVHLLTGLIPEKLVDLRSKMQNFIYVTGQYEAFNNGKEIDLNIQPKEFKSCLPALNELMEKIDNSSRFGSLSLLFHKNYALTSIATQALVLSKQYADATFKGDRKRRLEFLKNIAPQPLFSTESRAYFFHPWNEPAKTVKQIVGDEIKLLEESCKLS